MSHIHTVGFSDPISIPMQEWMKCILMKRNAFVNPSHPSTAYFSLNFTHRWSCPCSLSFYVPNLHPFCRTDAKRMEISLILFELSIVPCKHLLECMKLKRLVKLAPLAEIRSPTNQKHIFWFGLVSSAVISHAEKHGAIGSRLAMELKTKMCI